ncbi:hypothetical protein A2U01_0077722, partial [Trifolium medium]|nr:hypothetical protein [Trifolium medium]
MADDLEYLHEMAGEYGVEDNLNGAGVGSPGGDINEVLAQLGDHGDDQDSARPSPDLEGRRKKRLECDVDEGEKSD